jgi:DNA-binding NtrC family response regulator
MSETPTILVIDDETGSRESMALALEKTGVGVKTFDDAGTALDHLKINPNATIEAGHLVLPDAPGWGVEVSETAIRAHPPKA